MRVSKYDGSNDVKFEEIACPLDPRDQDPRAPSGTYYCPAIKKCWATRYKITDGTKKPAGPPLGSAQPRSRNTAVEASAGISKSH